MVAWKDHFRNCVAAFDFQPWFFDGEDKNMRALANKEAFVDWFAQEPGAIGNPYRDEGFYVRELTNVSLTIRPRNIVEFGTNIGLSTLLLRILNPNAEITTIDTLSMQYMPGDIKVVTGMLAKHNGVKAHYLLGDSNQFTATDVDMCFIDADHSYGAVVADSEQAWNNRNKDYSAIVWHDHNERHPGVIQAVSEFIVRKRILLNMLPDSSTVWSYK